MLRKILLIALTVLTVATLMSFNAFASEENYWPVKAEVKNTDSGVRLFVDGEVVIPMSSFGYLGYPVDSLQNGFWDTPVYSKESQRQLYMMCTNGLFDEGTKEEMKRGFAELLSRDPNALVILRCGAFSYNQWTQVPEIEVDPNYDYAITANGGRSGGWLSMSSEKWREGVYYTYKRGFDWMREQDFAKHIVGIMPGNATSSEWVYVGFGSGGENPDDYSGAARDAFRKFLKEKYGTNEELQKAWYDENVTFETAEIPTPAEREAENHGNFHNIYTGSAKVPDYNRFYNEQYANAVIYVSQVVKELTDNSIFTTYLYGYYLSYTITPRPVETGAFAVTKIMESPYVDSLSATNSYANRSPKSLNYNTMLVDSLALNGKLFFTEDDTRTYLAYTDIEAEGDGEGDREYKSKSFENTVAILGRNFSYDMIRDQGLYWMDMHNCGWYNNSDLWQQMAEMRRIWAAYNYSASSAPTPDVALIVDDESIYYESNSCPNSHYIMDQIDELVKAGLNYGVYLKCDIDKIPESAKIIIVTACTYMEADDIEAFNSQKRDGKIIIWNWAPSYITDTSCSVDNISSMTGMNIEEVESISNLMTKVTNFDHKYTKNADNQFGSLGKATPGFVVSDSEAVTLGIYKQSEYVSLAVKEFENWTSIFAGSGCLEAPVLASISNDIESAHSYNLVTNEAQKKDGIETDGKYLMYIPIKMGDKYVVLPEFSHVTDVANNKNLFDCTDVIKFESAGSEDIRFLSIAPGRLVKTDASALELAGAWKSENTSVISQTVGDTLTFKFNGTFVSLFADKGSEYGNISYTIDGVEYPKVNLYFAENVEDCEFVLANDLPDTEHTLTIKTCDAIVYDVPGEEKVTLGNKVKINAIGTTEFVKEEHSLTKEQVIALKDKTLARANGEGIEALVGNFTLNINGEGNYAVGAYEIEGYNYFKLRDVAMLLKDTVKKFGIEYDANTNKINVVLGTDYISVGDELSPVGEVTSDKVLDAVCKVYCSGSEAILKAYEIDGYNYYKLRDVLKLIGADVEWNEETKTINIVTK